MGWMGSSPAHQKAFLSGRSYPVNQLTFSTQQLGSPEELQLTRVESMYATKLTMHVVIF
jgi:hypothetical protein